MRPITNQSQGRHATMLLIPINSNEFFRILMDFVNTRIYFVSILCPKQNLFSIIICQPLLFALKSLIIVRNEVAKVMFLHQSVCPRGGVCPSAPGTPAPTRARHPPGTRHPPLLPGAGNLPGNGRYASYWNAFLFHNKCRRVDFLSHSST